MKSRFSISHGLRVILLIVMLCAIGTVRAATEQANTEGLSLPGVNMTEAKESDLMGQGSSCMGYKHQKTRDLCCKVCCSKGKCRCCPGYEGSEYFIGYWEASEVIEVSCRSGYSMLAPGSVPPRNGNRELQSCNGASKPGNSRWFFEARVWAINGYEGGLRHKAMGGTDGERQRQCHREGDDIHMGEYNGYGMKWTKFSRGSANGPSGSWEAYMSDKDPNWAPMPPMDGATPPDQQACSIGGVDMPNCWGNVTDNGWVVHPNPKVAAALVAWRAHQKAVGAGKVSPPGKGGGYKMAMEYPFLDYSGAYGQSMGMPGGSKSGSKCFQPGDSGPEWFGGKKPEEIPGFIKGLNPGQIATVAEINPGVYIFTVWVYTSCIRYRIPAKDPTPICHYIGLS